MPIARFTHRFSRLSRSLSERVARFLDQPANRAVILVFGIRVGAAGLALILQILVARWLLQFEYGIFAFVWAWLLLFGRLASLGFRTSIIRFIHQYQEDGDDDALRGILVGSRCLGVALSVTLGSLSALSVWIARDFVSNVYMLPIILAATVIPAFALSDIHEGIGRAKGWTLIGFLPHYIVRPLFFLILVAGAIFYGADASAVTALLCLIIASYGVAVIQFFKIEFNLRKTVSNGPRKFELAPALAVTLPIFLVEAFYELLTTSDVLIAGLLLDPQSVALYFAAAKIIAPLHFVLFAVAAAFAPRFAKAHAAQQSEHVAGILRQSVMLAFWPTLGLLIALLAAGQFLLGFFGEGFTEGYILLGILGCGILARASMGPCESLLSMSGHQNDAAKVYAGAFGANIALNLLLVPIFGIPGVAAATALSQIAEALFLSRAVKKHFGVHPFFLARKI